MKLEKIETAPMSKVILLYWKKDRHFEDGILNKNEDDTLKHTLYDGEQLSTQPPHWCNIPTI